MQRTALLLAAILIPAISYADGNRLAYLDEVNPWYPHTGFPKLVTPQWVGEEGVEAVVILSIDDMREPARYEQYLRPILNRLKAIDGRAPVSIMACSVRPDDPQLAQWLDEGLSIEVHTVDHPCPLLQGGDFAKAKSTYDRCIDLMHEIPGNRPVAFRTPCCDSLNTVSPRFFSEIFNRTTEKGHFLEIDSSVFTLFTADDPEIPRELLFDPDGREKFRKYLPKGLQRGEREFNTFVNWIENYPYPYVIGGTCWQFPCMVPSDWSAQHLHGVDNPDTVRDWKAALDITVLKQGVFCLVFHPHGWIKPEQIVELIDHAVATHGRKVKFLTFREAAERLNRSLLDGGSLRDATGGDRGIRLADTNGDGRLEVVKQDPAAVRRDDGTRFVDINEDGQADIVFSNHEQYRVVLWRNAETGWSRTILDHKRGDPEAKIVLPPIVREDGTNNGFFVHSRHLFWQNEDTADELDLVYRVSFDELLKDVLPGPKTPEASLKCMTPPPGFEVELVAAEPLVVDPVAFEWGADGRLWVAEMGDYPLGLEDQGAEGGEGSRKEAQKAQEGAEPGGLRGGRVRVLEDTDGDGRYDKSTVFLDGLNYPSGVLPWRNGVLVTAAPDILYAEDTTGDGRADVRVVLFTGFGEGNQQHRVNGLVYGLDNWVYCANGDSDGVIRFQNTVPRSRTDSRSQAPPGNAGVGRSASRDGTGATQSVAGVRSQAEPGNEKAEPGNEREVNISGRDFRFQPDTGDIELVTGRTQFGRSPDDWGNWFGCNNSHPMWHFALEDHYLRRNPHLAPPDPKVPVSVAPGPAPCFPISREMPRFNDFDRLNRFTSACSVIVYRDELFGPEFAGNSFVSEPVHNLVHREVMQPRGVTFTSRRAAREQQSEFLASRDNWFRPTTVKTGPDGALWIADMYRLVIEHPQYIPREMWDEWDFRAGDDRGRIYRVFPRSDRSRSQNGSRSQAPPGNGRGRRSASRAANDATRSVADVRSQAEPGNESTRNEKWLDGLTTAELVAALDSPNGWRRDTAQRLLVHAQDRSAVPLLLTMAASHARPLARLHALCTLDGLDALTPATLRDALADSHPGVRRHAVRLAEPLLRGERDGEGATAQGAGEDRENLGAAVVKLASDPDPHVRMQVAYTLGEWKHPAAGEALAAIALADAGDVYITTAVLSSLNRTNLDPLLTAVLRAAPETAEAARLLDRLLAQAAAIGSRETIVGLIGAVTRPDASGGHETWQFSAAARLLEAVRRRGEPLPKLLESAAQREDLAAQLAALFETAAHLASDETEEAPEPRRLAAIDLLPAHSDPLAQVQALADLIAPQQPTAIQKAAVAALARIDDTRAEGFPVADALLAAWKPLSPALRSQVVDVLLSRSAWAGRLVTALEDGRVAASELDAARRQRLLGQTAPPVRRRVEALFAGAIDPDRQKVLDAYQSALAEPGDAARGKAVFARACATCHRYDGAGHEVGPDLAALTDKSPQALLVAILDPNRAVESKYVNYVAVTTDGRQHSGLLAAETGNSLTLVGPENKRVELLRRDIEELTSTSKSTMPEGLEKDLSVQDVADVIAYLRGSSAVPE